VRDECFESSGCAVECSIQKISEILRFEFLNLWNHSHRLRKRRVIVSGWRNSLLLRKV